MAIIKIGSINDFSISAKPEISSVHSNLRGVEKFSELQEVSNLTKQNSFELFTSVDTRGVALKSITLTKGFENFLANAFKANNEIYFLAWAWDLSGENINQYPEKGTNPQDFIIPMKVGKLREFIGEGINLFPKRQVKGGISIRIHLWESDQDVRDFGKAMSDVANAIQKSELNHLLSLVSMIIGVSGATVNLIKDSALELTKVIGTILQANSNDYVDFFEGYYASDKEWLPTDERYEGNSSIICLRKY